MILSHPDRDRLVSLLTACPASSSCDDHRSMLLDAVLSAASVEPWVVPVNVITMKSVFTLIDLANGEIGTFAIVYPHEANMDRLKISVLDPLGAALIGRMEGDVVAFENREETRRYFVQKVLFQPERRFRESESGEPQQPSWIE